MLFGATSADLIFCRTTDNALCNNFPAPENQPIYNTPNQASEYQEVDYKHLLPIHYTMIDSRLHFQAVIEITSIYCGFSTE